MPAPSRNSPLFPVTFLLLAITAHLPAYALADNVLQVRSQSGAKLRTLLTGDPGSARANIMLLVGGKGILKISGKGQLKKKTDNFLVRTRDLFVSAGFLTALVDAPLDRRGGNGLLGGFRASTEHAKDLAKVARKLNALNGKPVIVIAAR